MDSEISVKVAAIDPELFQQRKDPNSSWFYYYTNEAMKPGTCMVPNPDPAFSNDHHTHIKVYASHPTVENKQTVDIESLRPYMAAGKRPPIREHYMRLDDLDSLGTAFEISDIKPSILVRQINLDDISTTVSHGSFTHLAERYSGPVDVWVCPGVNSLGAAASQAFTHLPEGESVLAHRHRADWVFTPKIWDERTQSFDYQTGLSPGDPFSGTHRQYDATPDWDSGGYGDDSGRASPGQGFMDDVACDRINAYIRDTHVQADLGWVGSAEVAQTQGDSRQADQADSRSNPSGGEQSRSASPAETVIYGKTSVPGESMAHRGPYASGRGPISAERSVPVRPSALWASLGGTVTSGNSTVEEDFGA